MFIYFNDHVFTPHSSIQPAKPTSMHAVDLDLDLPVHTPEPTPTAAAV